MHDTAVGGSPDGTIVAAEKLLGRFADQAVVLIEVDLAVALEVRDAAHAVANPQTAITIGSQRGDVGRRQFGICRRERVRRKLQAIEAVEAETGADPQIAVAGLRKSGNVAGSTVAAHPAHVRHVFQGWRGLGRKLAGGRGVPALSGHGCGEKKAARQKYGAQRKDGTRPASGCIAQPEAATHSPSP